MKRGPVSEIWPNIYDRAAVLGFLFALNTFAVTPDQIYQFPGLPFLLSRYTLAGPLQVDAIPTNRWQQEMEYGFQASLASMQSSMAAATQKGAI
jgi:hypothetical protein